MRRKLHIKHMLLFKRPSKRKNVIDIAILLDNNQYVEYSLAFKQSALTYWVVKRLKGLFNDYLIDCKTDIMFNNTIDEKHPMKIYIELLRPYVKFKMRTVTLDQIVGRVNYYFTQKSASKRKFNAVWKATIEKEVCPWITKQVDYALQNKTAVLGYAMKILRLGMFYMVVKNYLYSRNLNGKMNKIRSEGLTA